MEKPPREHTRLSAGIIITRKLGGTPHYLLLRAYHYWDFPKGEVERGEQPLQAAKREVKEETTLEGLDFRWGEVFLETPPYGHGKVARYYLAECQQGEVALPVSPELGHPEHHEFRWLSYPAARACLGERLQAVLDWAQALVTSKT